MPGRHTRSSWPSPDLQSAELHEDAEEIEGFVVYRFDAPLMYANAEFFADAARTLVEQADPPPIVLVVDCQEMFLVDSRGQMRSRAWCSTRVSGT